MSGFLTSVSYVGEGAGNEDDDFGTTILAGGVQIVGFQHGIGVVTSATLDGGAQYLGQDGGTGTATDTIIENNGDQEVGYLLGTGTAIDTTIIAGFQDVGGGGGVGSATSTTLEGAGAYQLVTNSGNATSTTISAGGVQEIDTGASFIAVIDGGVQYVGEAGHGFATSTTINGGTQYVGLFNGVGTAIDTIVNAGGVQIVADTGAVSATAQHTTINSSGEQQVFDFGTATDTTISGGAQYIGGGGGVASGATVDSGGYQFIGVGGAGLAVSTTIEAGGQQDVGDYGTGSASATTISGGVSYVGLGAGASGTAADTTILTGGAQFIGFTSGVGSATNTIIQGGAQYVGDGSGATGATSDTFVSAGEQVVNSGGVADSTTVYAGGVAKVLSGGGVVDAVIDGGTLQLDAGASIAGPIAFAADANFGTLDLTGEGSGSGFAFSGAISGFTGAGGAAESSDAIDVDGAGVPGDHLSWTQSGASGTLLVEDSSGHTLESLTLDGTYSDDQFVLSGPAAVEQILYDSSVACFVGGVKILTDRGERAIEELSVGDLVVTARGGLRPVRWLGRRRLDPARHARPEQVQPVRIEAGALAPGVPFRDLCVSPEHCLWLDETLVPAGALVNGATIRQEVWREVEYFHVELDGHDVLLAEGAPAESYLDCGNRDNFENGGATRRLRDERPLASLALAARLQARLAARAAELGRTDDLAKFRSGQRRRAEAPRQNGVRNPRGEGSAPGRVGEGGAMPAFWWRRAPSGVSIEIVGSGLEADLPYLDIRFVGHALAAGVVAIYPAPGAEIAAARGQEWSFSVYLRRLRGGCAAVAGASLYFDEYGPGGDYLIGEAHPIPIPTDDPLELQRVVAVYRIRHAAARAMTGYLQFAIQAGADVDLTLRIAGFQIEQGGYASDLMLPPPGAMGPVRRGSALADARAA
jgi:autotransporter passenger strand-loop-strand repeat protein